MALAQIEKTLTIQNTGGAQNIDLSEQCSVYVVAPTANPLTMLGDCTIAPQGTAYLGQQIKVLFDSSMILGVWGFSLFGYSLTPTQALHSWSARLHYNGTTWEVYFTQNGTTTGYINGVDIAVGSMPLNRLQGVYSANLIMGSVANVPVSVTVSGDLTAAPTGAFTVTDKAITNAKMADLASSTFKVGDSGNRPADVQMTGGGTLSNAGVFALVDGSVTPQKLSFTVGGFQIATLTLSSAQILALNGTPQQIIAAPGVGSIIVVQEVVCQQTFVTTAYTTNTEVKVYTETATVGQYTGDVLSFSTTRNVTLAKTNVGSAGQTQLLDNKGLFVMINTGNPAAGNGTMTVIVYYTIFPIPAAS